MKSATHRQIGLIRGINVGRAKRVAMADLRTMMTDLGYTDVRTLLNSGNVVFTGPLNGGSRIEAAMTKQLGVTARVTVISAAELDAAVKENSLCDMATDPTRLMMAVLSQATDRKLLTPLAKIDWTPEALAIGKRVAYMWCPRGILDSRLATALGKALGDAVTTRNWATVLKLHALVLER